MDELVKAACYPSDAISTNRITYVNTVNGVKLLMSCLNKEYAEMKGVMTSQGFDWEMNDYRELSERLDTMGCRLYDVQDGLMCGDYATGVYLIATALESTHAYEEIRSYDFGDSSRELKVPSIQHWVYTADFIMEGE